MALLPSVSLTSVSSPTSLLINLHSYMRDPCVSFPVLLVSSTPPYLPRSCVSFCLRVYVHGYVDVLCECVHVCAHACMCGYVNMHVSLFVFAYFMLSMHSTTVLCSAISRVILSLSSHTLQFNVYTCQIWFTTL